MPPQPDLTPEQLQTLQENRLKAKAAFQAKERSQQQQQQQQSTSRKRPLEVLPASNTSPTNPHKRYQPRQPPPTPSTSSSKALQSVLSSQQPPHQNDHFKGKESTPSSSSQAPLKNMIGSYVEYDLSTLKNSRGGFLLQGEEDDPRKKREMKLQEELKLKRLENARLQGQLRGTSSVHHHMSIDPKENPKCKHCGTPDLDEQLFSIFGVKVCKNCKKENPDLYSLLTKTECKEDYLLTEPELKDTELMPHLLRPNPHRPTYSNMMLFLRCQVEAYAFSSRKWGSPEALDLEFEKREKEKSEKKNKKFEKKLKELRKKTKTNVWHKRTEESHVHDFEEFTKDGGQLIVQRCRECGVEVEVESF